jgi:protein-S-isoprenylcysteine O-methyltransferase Ste14
MWRLTVVRVVLQWVGVLAILFALVAWLELPEWTRAIALLLSIGIMVGLLRAELAIRLGDLDARVTQMEKECATQSGTTEA